MRDRGLVIATGEKKMCCWVRYFGEVQSSFDINTPVTYTIYGENLKYKKGRNGGWCVQATPTESDGVDDSLIEAFLINNDIIIYFIKETDHIEANNINLVLKSTGGDGE